MAKEEQKTVTLRIPVRMFEDLTREDNITSSLINLYEEVKNEANIRMMDIRGIFTSDEWKALAAGLNGTLITDFTRYQREMFIAHNEDAELYEGSFSQFGVDVKVVNEKIARLTMIQVATVYKRISDFWENQHGDGSELDKWSIF